ncbi:MAG TPA: GIY-YIG nuclease family protein [Bacteroidia bacterium]|nr:GIY-YIG nuclease family protein [Bacteroidia bacterium]
MGYFVYILHSNSKLKYYTGSCQSIEDRLNQHNRGYSRFTKSGIPWKLVWLKEVLDRTEALQLENKIKKRGAQRFLEDNA